MTELEKLDEVFNFFKTNTNRNISLDEIDLLAERVCDCEQSDPIFRNLLIQIVVTDGYLTKGIYKLTAKGFSFPRYVKQEEKNIEEKKRKKELEELQIKNLKERNTSIHITGDNNQINQSSGNNASNTNLSKQKVKKPIKSPPIMATVKWIIYILGAVIAAVIGGYIIFKMHWN